MKNKLYFCTASPNRAHIIIAYIWINAFTATHFICSLPTGHKTALINIQCITCNKIQSLSIKYCYTNIKYPYSFDPRALGEGKMTVVFLGFVHKRAVADNGFFLLVLHFILNLKHAALHHMYMDMFKYRIAFQWPVTLKCVCK